MNHISHIKKKTQKFQLSQKPILPIQYYLQKILYIKSQSHSAHPSKNKRNQFNTHTNLASSLQQSKIFLSNFDQKRKTYRNKRSLSTKTNFQNSYVSNTNKFNTKTYYGKSNFQSINQRAEQNDRNRISTVSCFKNNSSLNKNKFSFTFNEIVTNPSRSSKKLVRSKQSLQLNNQDNQSQIKCVNFQDLQNAKKKIMHKISSYVSKLDDQGEKQLSQMLIKSNKRNIKSHNERVFFENRIKQMIAMNKDIVKILRQQLLSSNGKKSQSQRYSSRLSPKNNRKPQEQVSLGRQKSIAMDQLQPLSLQIHRDLQTQENKKSTLIEYTVSSQLFEQFKSVEQFQNSCTEDELSYQSQITHVTKEFSNQWEKAQNQKKHIYLKFRKTIFNNFPQLKQRQKILFNKKQKNLQSSEKSLQSNHIFDTLPTQLQNQNLAQFNLTTKNQSSKNINISEKLNSHNNPLILGKKMLQYQNKNFLKQEKGQLQQAKQSKQSQKKLSTSQSKVTLRSKKNNVSIGSTKTLSILKSSNKEQTEKINLPKVIQFIFKRAYFYSVSKRRVIQNNTGLKQIQIKTEIKQKKPNISFLAYNSKSKEKKYHQKSKLNNKKQNASGNFLIKNKFNIMEIQKESYKAQDFLRKCLEDAIQDYLNTTNSR